MKDQGIKTQERFFYTHKDGMVVGFYSDAIGTVPDGAVEISEVDRAEALALQEGGKDLVVIDGKIAGRDPQVNELMRAKSFVTSELLSADIQISYHEDADPRKVAAVEDWREYRRQLRDYVKNGIVASIKPERPGV